jgi:hypothetical protein
MFLKKKCKIKFLTSLIFKKIKWTKKILEKIITKKSWGNTVAIHSVLKKKNTVKPRKKNKQKI